MPNKTYGEKEDTEAEADPRSGTSLVPMLVGGLVLIVVGMIVVAALT